MKCDRFLDSCVPVNEQKENTVLMCLQHLCATTLKIYTDNNARLLAVSFGKGGDGGLEEGVRGTKSDQKTDCNEKTKE